MGQIKIKNLTLDLNPLIVQTSPNGRPIRLSGISKNLQVPERWINKVLCNYWIYTFIFTDEEGGFIHFEFDYNNNFIKHFKSWKQLKN